VAQPAHVFDDVVDIDLSLGLGLVSSKRMIHSPPMSLAMPKVKFTLRRGSGAGSPVRKSSWKVPHAREKPNVSKEGREITSNCEGAEKNFLQGGAGCQGLGEEGSGLVIPPNNPNNPNSPNTLINIELLPLRANGLKGRFVLDDELG